MEIKLGEYIGKDKIVGAILKGGVAGKFWPNSKHLGYVFLEGCRGALYCREIARIGQIAKLGKREGLHRESGFKREIRRVDTGSGKVSTVTEGLIYL